MEEADAVDLSKENIQPLKQGRNASILGLALQAQNDEQLHQRLLKMQEAYEIKIRTYNGPDPLELWVEYISWVEQSFPKHGLEGNLEVLLQKCFNALKNEERYKQDLRFVKLWIKFIEMQTNDRLELYRFLSGQEIGTACAEFYQSWANEFEQVEDYKHADAVYQLGYKNVAQPAEELEAAHVQFELRFARALLRNQKNDVQETSLSTDSENQRSAMAALCPVGPKNNKVGTVRVGPNVISATPGTFTNPHATAPLFGSNSVARDRIQIYKEDSSDSVGVLGRSQANAPSTSVNSYRNKENTLGAGTWNKAVSVRSKLPTQHSLHQSQPAGPSFEVHRDEASGEDPWALGPKTFTPNVLKPRKHEENHLKETLAVYEQPDPNVRVMYPKEKIYGGMKELQLEEIMAIEYWKEKTREGSINQERHRLEQMKRDIELKLKLLSQGSVATPPESVEDKMDTAEATDPVSTALSSASSVAETSDCSKGSDNSKVSDIQSERKESTGQESSNGFPRMGENPSSNSLNVLLTPGNAPSCLAANGHSSTESSVEKGKGGFGSGNRGHTSIYNQSITVHTKLAMHEVDDLWRSPNPAKDAEFPAPCLPRVAPLSDESVLAFDICRDETDVSRPPQPRAPLGPASSGLKTPLVLSERPVADPSGGGVIEMPAEDAEESLARTLAPEASIVTDHVFKQPVVAALRGSLKKGPTEKKIGDAVLGGQVPPLNRIQIEPENPVGLMRPPPLVTESPELTSQPKPVDDFPIFTDPSGMEWQAKPELAKFDVFVDEETRATASAVSNGVPPPNKLNVIAKEKENAQKFSLMEIEEIEQKPQVVPPRRSILPQFNTQFEDRFKGNASSRDFPEDDDVTCSTKVFSGGFLVASTPFTGAVARSKAPEMDFASEDGDRDMNGSIFVVPPSEDAAPSKSVFKEIQMDDNQLSTIYEVSSSSTRTSSSQSAVSATYTATSAYKDQGGTFACTETHLHLVAEEDENVEGEFNEPYHHDVTICINGDVDPFNKLLVDDLLKKNQFPQPHHKEGICWLNRNVPTKRSNTFTLENDNYKIIRQLGEGAYAKVWHVVDERTNCARAMKIQKPSWQWEFYICREIQVRLSDKAMAAAFMQAEKMYVFNNGSVLLTNLIQYGSLLDLSNKLNSGTLFSKKEACILIIADHLLRVVDALHSCDIIHGDLKPDNVLIRSVPSMESTECCLALIDFGRSIDMSLFPPGTTFQRNVKTDGFACIEMQTNRPWTYQTDLYGLASCIHCLLLGQYMKVRQLNGRWQVQQSMPRSVNKERWNNFFGSLLNIDSCSVMPNLQQLRQELLSGFSPRLLDYIDLERIIKQ